MQAVRLQGGTPLKGSVEIGGAKNAGLPLLTASILSEEPVTLSNVPDLRDIRFMMEILEHLGVEVNFQSGNATLHAQNIEGNPSYDLVKKMRASVCLMGPLVARLGEVQMPFPGGCVIGQRPIDLHLRGLEKLGCDIHLSNGLIHLSTRQLRGATIFLGGRYGSTVTGTANILGAAILAKGTTVIQSAACEPEIIDLCLLLKEMGAQIEGIGSPTLTIHGVDRLHGASHRLIMDRIEYGTFLLLALITKSAILLPKIPEIFIGSLMDILLQSGAVFESHPDGLLVRGDLSELRPMEVTTLPFPGFPTDLQAPLTALLAQVEGISIITERIYPHRFMHVQELARMGAEISLEGPSAIIKGRTPLSGAPVMASDLRAGASLYMAGLAAKGETIIQRVYHVDRGYDHLDDKLRALGAKIERIDYQEEI